MSSDIERVIQRDLDQLPLLPAERWVPAPARPVSRPGALLRGAAVTVGMLALALVLGTGLSRLRVDNADRAATTTSAAAATAPGAPGRISRQAAIARVYGLQTAVTRIEAKLVGRNALQAVEPLPGAAGRASELTWVVAVSGDIRCNCIMDGPPAHSGLYLLDAMTGAAFASTASSEFWPIGFDALADASVADGSVTFLARVEEIRGPDLTIRTDLRLYGSLHLGSATPAPIVGGQQRFVLRADADTQFSWGAGALGGTAASLDELVQRNLVGVGDGAGAIVQVTFDPQQRSDGTYRLEALLTGVMTR